MEPPSWAPRDAHLDPELKLNLERPNAARMYDYFLGGFHNVGADRELARQVVGLVPDVPRIAQANRAFLRRAVRYCVDAGLRQFLDLGSGIPTVGNVHDVAQRAAPDCRVVYVDVEPVAVAISRTILAGNERAAVVRADLRDPEGILGHPGVRDLLDFRQPLAVLMVAVLPFIEDAADPWAIVARVRDELVGGSHLVVSHLVLPPRVVAATDAREHYKQTSTPVTARTSDQIERLFAGFELIDPGLVYLQQWRPERVAEIEDRPDWSKVYAGVGRKPG